MRNSPNSGNSSPSIGNARVTSIVVNANETASFYDGTSLLRAFGTVRNISASFDRQYIIIEENNGSLFRFDVWALTQIGSQAYSLIDRFSSTAQADYNTRFEEVFYLLCVRIFKACCDCSAGSTTGGQFIYEYNSATSTGDFYFVSGILLMSLTADDGQDMTGILENLPNGSWITFIGSANPDNFVTFEISSYYVASGIAIFSATVIAGDSSAFADTDLFATYFDKAGSGTGGGVETVTGTAVDNTDPLNPVIDYTPWNDLTGVPEDNEDLVNRVQNSEWIFGSTTGTNTYIVNLSPALLAYQTGQVFWLLFGNANTGASTINVNSLGAKSLVKNVSTTLVSGDIPAGAILPVMYDGTNFQVDLKYTTPTWQQVLIAGATLTQNNTIAGGGFQFTWNNLLRFFVNTTDRLGLTADDGAGTDVSIVLTTATGEIIHSVESGGVTSTMNHKPTGWYFDKALFRNLGTAIASAATTNIGAATGDTVHITGTTTITAFDSIQHGVIRNLIFDGALTLTHNATSLILPTGANITTAAGDSVEFTSEGSGNWRCTKYERASGIALAEEGFSDWSGSLAPTGFSATTEVVFYYRYPNGSDECHFSIRVVGTSNAAGFNVTLPFAAASTHIQRIAMNISNSGTNAIGYLSTAAGSTTATITRDTGGGFTASGTKAATGNGFYITT